MTILKAQVHSVAIVKMKEKTGMSWRSRPSEVSCRDLLHGTRLTICS
jgi:hypothetical protein